jgi:hypothetical protein
MNGTQTTTRQELTYPAAYEHEVVMLSCVAQNGEPAHVDLIRRDTTHDVVRTLPAGRLYVGIRAGRMTFATCDGTEQIGLTLLGDKEAAGLKVGDPWPRSGAPDHHGKAVDALSKTVRAVGHALNPSAFWKAMHSSSERNQALDTVLYWCRREMPDTHVLYNAQHGADQAAPRQRPAGSRKGLIGAPGWDEDESGKPTD